MDSMYGSLSAKTRGGVAATLREHRQHREAGAGDDHSAGTKTPLPASLAAAPRPGMPFRLPAMPVKK